MITESLNVIANAAAVDAAATASFLKAIAEEAHALRISISAGIFVLSICAIMMAVARLIEACKK